MGTHGGITATSPGRMVRDLPVELELELPLEHDDDLLLLMDVGRRNGMRRERHEVGQHLLTEHGPELEAGTNSTGSISLTVTNRPGPFGTPRASLLKWGSPPTPVIADPAP